MTVIEFFDRESAVENIVSALLCAPEKVIFVGNNTGKMNKAIDIYKSVAEKRGLDVKFEPKCVEKELMSIVGALEDIIEENEDCVFDLSGGDDLYLVALGVVYGEFSDSIQLHRFNISNNCMVDCDSDGKTCASAPVEMTVEESIAINGGRVVYTKEKSGSTYGWDLNDEFVDDIYVMWSICKENPGRWNSHINTLDKLCVRYLDPEELAVYINVEEAKHVLGEAGEKYKIFYDIFKKLNSFGIIENLRSDDISFSFKFKNSQVMKCLTKAGTILELIVTVMAADAEDDDGNPVYNDIMTGVFIDWDGCVQPEHSADVENEIDVILMKGLVPVFVSCKNGSFDMNELYKLSVVAERFGGKFVRKAIVASELEKMGTKMDYIKARADAMGIEIVDDVDAIAETKFRRKIKNLWIQK